MRRTIDSIGSDHVRGLTIVTDLGALDLDQSTPIRLLESASQAVLERLPPLHGTVELVTANLEDLTFPALYQPKDSETPARITIAVEVLDDPLRTVMELANQYSNHYWNQIDQALPLDTDPRTTHLLPICCGLGILASDASLYDQQWTRDGFVGWSLSRSGYYTAIEIGYAMALLARFLGEESPSWVGRLRLDSRATLVQATRYFDHLRKTGRPLLFDAGQIPSSSMDQKQLAEWLSGDDPSFALAAAHALGKQSHLSASALEAAMAATHSRDRQLVPLATKLLGAGRLNSPAARQRVEELIQSSEPVVSFAAVQAAQALGIPLDRHQNRISRLLDQLPSDVLSILEVIGKQGRRFASFETRICEHLTRAIQTSDDELASALIECLRRTSEEPRRAIESRIRPKETCQVALKRLETAI